MAVITQHEAGTSLLPRSIAGMIFEDIARTSIVQQLARRIDLPASGVAIPVTTGKPTASWVSEAGRKPASDASLDVKLMDPKKIATIVVFSKEFLSRDTTGLFAAIRPQIAEAFADAFDAAAIHGTSSPFVNYLAETSHTVVLGNAQQSDGGIYADIVAGLRELADDRKRLTGFAADPIFEPIALGAVDTTGRPLLVDVGGNGLTQRLIGRPVGFGEGVSGPLGTEETVRLVGGDWRKAAYGVGTSITYSVSREASIEMPAVGTADPVTVHLFQDNLVALLAEAEYGWVVGDVDSFVTYTEASS